MFVRCAGGAQEAVIQYSIAAIAQPHYVAPTGAAMAIGFKDRSARWTWLRWNCSHFKINTGCPLSWHKRDNVFPCIRWWFQIRHREPRGAKPIGPTVRLRRQVVVWPVLQPLRAMHRRVVTVFHTCVAISDFIAVHGVIDVIVVLHNKTLQRFIREGLTH